MYYFERASKWTWPTLINVIVFTRDTKNYCSVVGREAKTKVVQAIKHTSFTISNLHAKIHDAS